jgi:phosphotransferase system IIA component
VFVLDSYVLRDTTCHAASHAMIVVEPTGEELLCCIGLETTSLESGNERIRTYWGRSKPR